MKTLILAFVALTNVGVSSLARAENEIPAAKPTASQPSVPAPKDLPPPPPAQVPAAPHAQPLEPRALPNQPAAAATPTPPGQWVFTQQYGWLWMPYEGTYTQVAPDAALAYSYVFYPTFGWRWVVAPWVLGFGVAPYWGPLGVTHFGWRARPRFVAPTPFRGRGWTGMGHGPVGHVGRVGGHGRH